MIALIVAVAANGLIGRDNAMPWHLPEDLRYFKKTTMGKPVVMGRKTFCSIGRALPGRPNIVITRDPVWTAEGVETAQGLAEGLLRAEELADGGEVMVIGGAQIFEAALPLATRLYLTEVHRVYEGDVFFPGIVRDEWVETSREDHRGDPDWSYVVLERKPS